MRNWTGEKLFDAGIAIDSWLTRLIKLTNIYSDAGQYLNSLRFYKFSLRFVFYGLLGVCLLGG